MSSRNLKQNVKEKQQLTKFKVLIVRTMNKNFKFKVKATKKNLHVHILLSFTWRFIVFSIYPPKLKKSAGGGMHRGAVTHICFRRFREIATP